MSQLLSSDDQNTGASTSASVLPMSVQGLFPLRLAILIQQARTVISENIREFGDGIYVSEKGKVQLADE